MQITVHSRVKVQVRTSSGLEAEVSVSGQVEVFLDAKTYQIALHASILCMNVPDV